MKKLTTNTCECCGGNLFKRIDNYVIECEYCGTQFESKIKEAERNKTENVPIGHTCQLYSVEQETDDVEVGPHFLRNLIVENIALGALTLSGIWWNNTFNFYSKISFIVFLFFAVFWTIKMGREL